MISSATAMRVTAGSRCGAAATSRAQSRPVPAPACAAAALSSRRPSRASAIPVEQIITYFQAASTAALVRRWPTRNAVTIVVPSIATQTTPRLAARTATVMAARNSWTSTLCRAAVRAVARPAVISPRSHAGVEAVASNPTAPITISMKSDSESARTWPSSTVAGECPAWAQARPMAATSTSAPQAGASQAVDRRQPASR